jgi:hypothetical protein
LIVLHASERKKSADPTSTKPNPFHPSIGETKMKTKTTHRKRKHDTSLSHALSKGALVWGPIYSMGSSTAAYWIGNLANGSSPAYGDIFLDSLVIFPLIGILGEVAKWRIKNHKPKNRIHRKKSNRRNRTNRFNPGSHPLRWSPMNA